MCGAVCPGVPLTWPSRRRDNIAKRDTFSNNSYTEPAVVCADSVDADPAVTMDVIFDEIVAVNFLDNQSVIEGGHALFLLLTEFDNAFTQSRSCSTQPPCGLVSGAVCSASTKECIDATFQEDPMQRYLNK